MTAIPILESSRLILRPFEESDVAAFYVLGSEPQIIRFTHDPAGGFQSLEEALQVLRSHPLADYQQHGFGRLACVDKTTGDVIGFAGLKYLSELNEVDLGYRFLPSHWGRGLATESGRAILSDGFERLRLGRIIGLVDPDNLPSQRVLQKLGMKTVGSFDYDGCPTTKFVIERSV